MDFHQIWESKNEIEFLEYLNTYIVEVISFLCILVLIYIFVL